MPDGATPGASRDNRKAIPVSCALHQDARATRSSSTLMSPGSGVIIFEGRHAGNPGRADRVARVSGDE
ncbi:MAG: hypothetical protein ACRDRU_22865 [Pseudonocardiaceae bacterium]